MKSTQCMWKNDMRSLMTRCFQCINKVCSSWRGSRHTYTHTFTHTYTHTQNDCRNPYVCVKVKQSQLSWEVPILIKRGLSWKKYWLFLNLRLSTVHKNFVNLYTTTFSRNRGQVLLLTASVFKLHLVVVREWAWLNVTSEGERVNVWYIKWSIFWIERRTAAAILVILPRLMYSAVEVEE